MSVIFGFSFIFQFLFKRVIIICKIICKIPTIVTDFLYILKMVLGLRATICFVPTMGLYATRQYPFPADACPDRAILGWDDEEPWVLRYFIS